MTSRAARFGLLQYFIKGASSGSTYFRKRRRKMLVSRPRPVLGLKPGSNALKRNLGNSRLQSPKQLCNTIRQEQNGCNNRLWFRNLSLRE